jgi:hypothetical protein
MKKKISIKSVLLKIIIPILIGVFIYEYNLRIGVEGLYLFDSSISLNMGWLIYNDFLPFVDFKSPLMPLSGLLTSLGFWFYGINYFSSVKIASVLVLSAFLIIFSVIKRYLNLFNSYWSSALIILSTVPITGTLYYNHLSALLFVIYIILIVDYVLQFRTFLKNNETIKSTIIFLVIGFLLLNKLHIGILCLLLFLIIECFLMRKIDFRSKKIFLSIFIRIFPILFLFLALLFWIDFSFLKIYDSLFKSTDISSLNYSTYFFERLGFNDTNTIFSKSSISIGLNFLIAIGIVNYHFKFYKNNLKANLMLIIIIGSLFVQLFSYLFSAEAPSIDLSFIMINLLIMYIYFNNDIYFQKNSNSKNSFHISKIFIIPLFISCALFSLYYSNFGLRKSFLVDSGKFPMQKYIPKNFFNTDIKFLYNVKINHNQKINFDYLNEVLINLKSDKIFFGPGLELFYPAFKSTQPNNWPLWLHKGLSYNSVNYSSMINSFRQQNYQIIVINKLRYDGTYFINNYIKKNYMKKNSNNPDIWIDIYTKKE